MIRGLITAVKFRLVRMELTLFPSFLTVSLML